MVAKVRQALHLELPSIEFVDDVIEHFASFLEDGHSDEDVEEAFR